MLLLEKVHQNQNPEFHKWLINENINNLLTEYEKAFVDKELLDKVLNVEFSWRAEGKNLVAILWALGIIKEMPSLNKQFDVFSIKGVSDIINSPHAFISSAKLIEKNRLIKKS